jgi:enoyl-CoA hydratase/carnithine racemase
VSQPLLIEHEDGYDRVTLNRPESLNALDPSLIEALNVYFHGLQRNRATRLVVLKGAGNNFCAGLDLKHAMKRRAGQQEPPGVTESLDSQRRIADIVMLMRRCPQPILALIKGAAAGGGFALALASDIRIATKSARMNCAFIKLGVGGCDIGTSYFLRVLSACRWHPNSFSPVASSAPSGRLASALSPMSSRKTGSRLRPNLTSMRCSRPRRWP